MLKSIFNKEWLKLKIYVFVLLVLIVASLSYFAFNLNFSFKTIEPESMMWYKFAHLQDKPYYYLSYLFLLLGTTVAFVQYIPEKVAKRIKIMAHLPLALRDALFGHIFIGFCFILFLCSVLGVGLLVILAKYYPYEILQIATKDILFYTFTSIVLYIGLSSIILEVKNKIAFVKFIFLAIFLVIFLKERYETNDLIWITLLVFIPFLALDSFYSIKQQRLESNIFRASFVVLSVALLYFGYENYKENYKHTFNKYYLFYSNIIDDFVYQKNFGEHQYEYGVKSGKTFDQYEYESYLPFVYWRNLDIQGKLPIAIHDVIFDRNNIKDSRLGFDYNPAFLKKPEIGLYPLLNPIANKGMIVFPEEAFIMNSNNIAVYDFDHKYLETQSNEINQMLKDVEFKHPALQVWGKSTNMKPFDKGYLIKDSNGKLFNLARANGITKVDKVHTPENIEIIFARLSENRQKRLSGYAIDKNGEFYLLTWDFEFIKLELEDFDYKTMKLKLISNPLNYLIRYDNGEKYYATVFLREDFSKIKSVVFE